MSQATVAVDVDVERLQALLDDADTDDPAEAVAEAIDLRVGMVNAEEMIENHNYGRQ